VDSDLDEITKQNNRSATAVPHSHTYTNTHSRAHTQTNNTENLCSKITHCYVWNIINSSETNITEVIIVRKLIINNNRKQNWQI